MKKLMLICVLLFAGCGPSAQQEYDAALQTWKTESELLTQLRADAANVGNADAAIAAARGRLESATRAKELMVQFGNATPEELAAADRMIADAQKTVAELSPERMAEVQKSASEQIKQQEVRVKSSAERLNAAERRLGK
jgi:hypothetical protein